jgi:lipopolysaccharide export system protein LptA
LGTYNGAVNTRAIFVPRFVIHSLILGLSLVWAAPFVRAERADRDKPMNVESDRLDHDDLRLVSVFQGRVVLTKGTLILKGDRIEVREDPQGFQYGQVIPKAGEKAFYRQKREGVNEWIEGEADRIEYDGKADVVTLIRQARLRRYLGTQLNDEFTGDRIVYENPKDQFSIQSANPSSNEARSGNAPSNRVRAVLTPKRTPTP